MKTPLHDSMESWFATREGHIPFWKWTDNGRTLVGHTGDISFLIESANKYLGKNDFKKMSYIPYDHVFGYSLGVWMAQFVEMSDFLHAVPLNFLNPVPVNFHDCVPPDFHRVVPRQK